MLNGRETHGRHWEYYLFIVGKMYSLFIYVIIIINNRHSVMDGIWSGFNVHDRDEADRTQLVANRTQTFFK